MNIIYHTYIYEPHLPYVHTYIFAYFSGTSDSDSDSGDVYSIKLDMFKGPDGHRQPSDYGNFFQEYAHPTTRASRRRVPSVRRRCVQGFDIVLQFI